MDQALDDATEPAADEMLSRTELQIEQEKLKLERERILLERERLEAVRDRVKAHEDHVKQLEIWSATASRRTRACAPTAPASSR